MGIELKFLAWAVVLGFVQLLLADVLMTAQRGTKWNVGPRDGEPKPLSGMAARAERAFRNFLETFAFFAAAVLAVALTHKSDASSLLGAQIYVWARMAYLPIYLVGIPYLRTLVWAASFWGMLQVIETLL